MNTKNTFQGNDALFQYLNPANGQFTPLVELPAALNPFRDYNVHIHAKMLSALPLGNVKSIPAFSMLENATGTHKKKIIESSSGNTAASLGVLGQYFGFDQVNAYVSHEVTRGKLKMLQLFGVTPVVNQEPICPSENDLTSGIHKAREKGLEKDWYNPDQYANPGNIGAHYKVTGRQIWQQMNGRIDYFCAGLGTTGTMTGTAKYLKNQDATVQTIGVVRSPNNPVPGPRTRNLLDDIAFDWQENCDHLVDIGTVKSYETSLKMIRLGLLAGPSSGMNLAGAHEFIQSKIDNNEFQKNQPDIHVVVPCCDTPFPYVDEYFKVLQKQDFPVVENAHLLQFTENYKPHNKVQSTAIVPEALFEILKAETEGHKVIDIRVSEKYAHYHIPGSINIPENDFITNVDTFADLYKDETLYFVCDYGNRSRNISRYAQTKNINAVNVEGGLAEWSEQDLPRVRDEKCVLRYNLV